MEYKWRNTYFYTNLTYHLEGFQEDSPERIICQLSDQQLDLGKLKDDVRSTFILWKIDL